MLVACTPAPAPHVDDGVVEAGDVALHVHCMGRGAPTVLFDAGLGMDGSAWGEVQYDVAQHTRACVYDRAGLGYSAPPPARRRTARSAASELHQVLARAGIEGPFVLVGHSFGGLDMELFAASYGAKGLVLIDAMSSEQETRYWSLLPAPVLAEFRASLQHGREGFDYAALVASLAEARAAAPRLANVALVVITHGRADPPPPGVSAETADAMERAWQEMQTRLLELSTDHRQVVATKSGHLIARDEPDVITAAVLGVVMRQR